MFEAYPRHIVNLRPGLFGVLLRRLFSGKLLRGEDIEAFESQFAKYVGVKFCIGVAQARLGLIAVLRSLCLEKGSEILLAAYNFYIIAEVVEKSGFKPVYADIDAATFNINPQLIKQRITPKTRAIIVTHLFGQAAEMDEILRVAHEHKLWVIEDCAHSLGTQYKGKKTGSFGDVAIFSLGMGKNMPCFGGGLITTKEASLYARLKHCVDESQPPSANDLRRNVVKCSAAYLLMSTPLFSLFTFPLMRLMQLWHRDISDFEKREEVSDGIIRDFSSLPLRLLNVQAAIGLRHLACVDHENDLRSLNSEFIARSLRGIPGIVPAEFKPGATCLYYKVRVENKEKLARGLLRRGVDVSRHSDMVDCSQRGHVPGRGCECPNAASLEDHLLGIPNNHWLKRRDVEYIVKAIKEVLAEK